MHADWFSTMYLQLDRNTDLAQAVDKRISQVKRIYILIIKSQQVDFLFCITVFFKRNRKHVFHVFIEL